MGDLTKNISRYEIACKCGCGFDTIDIEVVRMCDGGEPVPAQATGPVPGAQSQGIVTTQESRKTHISPSNFKYRDGF